MNLIIITGPPGSGKGTQAKLLANHLDYIHISTGELLRKEISMGTEFGKYASKCIDNGGFIPDELAFNIIDDFLTKNQETKGYIFDGYPRTLEQCAQLDKIIEKHTLTFSACIDLSVNKDILVDRLQSRNKELNRPEDSSIEIINYRLSLYEDLVLPINKWFCDKKNLITVNSEKSPNEVFTEIINRIPQLQIN